ncbi:hypothetical protein [Vibrio gallaecicus]|nr:hypothetical protein [Vibrio gallaecicus]MDN3612938.1 hypothetical protein [Vibrio gallaecicus]
MPINLEMCLVNGVKSITSIRVGIVYDNLIYINHCEGNRLNINSFHQYFI